MVIYLIEAFPEHNRTFFGENMIFLLFKELKI